MMILRIGLVALVILPLVILPCQARKSLQVKGEQRFYLLHVPESYTGDVAVPLVLFLHGRGGSAATAAAQYGFTKLAETHGFLVAYPSAKGSPTQWRPGGRDKDVQFLRALIDEIGRRYRIDASRVYVCGHSFGGIMSHAAAAYLADKVAAIAVMAGSIGFRSRRSDRIPKPRHPVSVLIFHARDDRVVPFEGGRSTGPFSFVSAPESVALWVTHNACEERSRRSFAGDTVKRTSWWNGTNGAEVVFYEMASGGHDWPAPETGSLDATALMWEFFSEHAKVTKTPRVPVFAYLYPCLLSLVMRR